MPPYAAYMPQHGRLRCISIEETCASQVRIYGRKPRHPTQGAVPMRSWGRRVAVSFNGAHQRSTTNATKDRPLRALRRAPPSAVLVDGRACALAVLQRRPGDVIRCAMCVPLVGAGIHQGVRHIVATTSNMREIVAQLKGNPKLDVATSTTKHRQVGVA